MSPRRQWPLASAAALWLANAVIRAFSKDWDGCVMSLGAFGSSVGWMGERVIANLTIADLHHYRLRYLRSLTSRKNP